MHATGLSVGPGASKRELGTCRAARGPASTYYKNYLRNRQQTGGTFLGPPVLQQPWQQQQQKQAGEGAAEAAAGPQPEAVLGCASLLTPASLAAAPGAAATTSAVLSAGDLQQLLQQCLEATSAGPEGFHSSSSSSSGRARANVVAGGGHGCHLREPAAAVPHEAGAAAEQLLPGTVTRVLQPWEMPDYIPDDLAESLVPALRPRRGVTVMPPVIMSSEPRMPLPELPCRRQQQQQAPGAIPSSASPRLRVLHVLWDVSSAHPGGSDPRVVVAQLRRVLGCYGRIASVAAYAVQKMFYWVPEAFMLQYAPQRLPGFKRRQAALQQQQQLQLRPRRNGGDQQQNQNNQDQQQQQQQQPLETLLGGSESVGPLRCPACGKLRNTYRQLHLHMVQRHKQPAPPLARLLPASALAAAAAAATAANATASNSSQPLEQPLEQQQQQQPGVQQQWRWSAAMAMQNSSTRTLGRVTAYHNSQGLLFVPPVGHQISLKYVLAREGVEVRTVQNQRRAVDASLAAGLQQLLERLLLRDASSAAAVEDVAVVVSDKAAHAPVLARLQRAGITTVVVCRRRAQQPGADVQLRWQWVVDGRYETAEGA